MKKCKKCGHQVNGPIHYCPFCGTLLPGENEMVLVNEDEYKQAMKETDNVEMDSKRWNEILSFYQSHLSTGYAPKGKQLVSKNELAQLRKDNQEYEQAKKTNGVNLYGSLYCKVTQRHQRRTNYIGFKDYWRKLVKKDSTYDLWCNLFFILLCVSYGIIGFILLIALIDGMGGWGFLLALLLAAPFIIGGLYISLEILDS